MGKKYRAQKKGQKKKPYCADRQAVKKHKTKYMARNSEQLSTTLEKTCTRIKQEL